MSRLPRRPWTMMSLQPTLLYRTIISVALLVNAVAAAPQDNTNVTYIRIEPILETDAPDTPIQNDSTESTFDDLNRFTIPGLLEKEVDRHLENIDVTTEDDQSETTTEIYEVTTKKVEQTTHRKRYRSKPRFISKLSYYNNANQIDSPTNDFVEKFAKRKYKSKCRCAKIWNCPKLQISVPRCPDEYFMCCF